jgi:hypothetical protein
MRKNGRGLSPDLLRRGKIVAKCTQCGLRKAKRHCPALGTAVCSLCCGRLREKKLHCPPGCPHLAQHKSYQESRIIQKKQAFSADVLADERLSWLSVHIEAPLKEYGDKQPDFTDRDAVIALEYAKEKIERDRSKLILSQDEATVRNDVGEAILQSIEQCRFERKIILPQEMAGYKKEEKLKCLENVILAVKLSAKGDLAGRNYLRQLIQRFGRLREAAAEKKIVSLS